MSFIAPPKVLSADELAKLDKLELDDMLKRAARYTTNSTFLDKLPDKGAKLLESKRRIEEALIVIKKKAELAEPPTEPTPDIETLTERFASKLCLNYMWTNPSTAAAGSGTSQKIKLLSMGESINVQKAIAEGNKLPVVGLPTLVAPPVRVRDIWDAYVGTKTRSRFTPYRDADTDTDSDTDDDGRITEESEPEEDAAE